MDLEVMNNDPIHSTGDSSIAHTLHTTITTTEDTLIASNVQTSAIIEDISTENYEDYRALGPFGYMSKTKYWANIFHNQSVY
jgi:hypothetical protein